MWTKPIGGKKRWITHDSRTTTLHDGRQGTAVYVMWLRRSPGLDPRSGD